MTEKKEEKDIRTRYEFLIAGIVALILCIFAFVAFRITSYLNGARATDSSVTTIEASDGTVLIEVEIRETADPEEPVEEIAETMSEVEEIPAIVNEHDNILIFTTTKDGENYYQSKTGRLPLYHEPKETEDSIPSLMEGVPFEVLGFSRDGWAAIEFGGEIYYVKSADIIQTDVPEKVKNAMNASSDDPDAPKAPTPKNTKNPYDTQGIRFFTPNAGDIEYVVTMNTRAFSEPDIMSSGNTVDLKKGERVIVVGQDGDWYKIIYMNAEYYVLSYLEPRADYIENNPDEEIIDNTGYAPAGSSEAASSAASAGADDNANSGGVASDGSSSGGSSGGSSGSGSSGSDSLSSSGSSGSSDSTDRYEEANATAPSGYAREILTLTNAEREKAGLEPLEWDPTLAYCASVRAEELPLLTYEQNLNHLRPDGRPWYSVNEDAMWAENIAYGQTSAQEVFNAWLNSSGHYANMMKADYRTFAVALYQTDSGDYNYYWIEEFGY